MVHKWHDDIALLLHLVILEYNASVQQCKSKGLEVAVASSADLIKVNANLAAAGLPTSLYVSVVNDVAICMSANMTSHNCQEISEDFYFQLGAHAPAS